MIATPISATSRLWPRKLSSMDLSKNGELNARANVKGNMPIDNVINVRDLDPDQRRNFKGDGLEHGNRVDDGFSFVGQASGSSSSLKAALFKVDSMKQTSRCRSRIFDEL